MRTDDQGSVVVTGQRQIHWARSFRLSSFVLSDSDYSMATKPNFECPVCHQEIAVGEQLVDHLHHNHSKDTLAEFVATEAVAMEEEISE
ncbi:hypothetical protein EA462_11250 [Natrarchaeobius halalkaliphilus]|uniref:C2H2-type domain-containing protein n=2 Tax=Natrarchaeobius halalkaliphilus TaxID=1679091 RepID=A0A3N6LK59_9EURY|nr:hypothetical protein EA462_11250 [Natrarchaeobius halalkaliphilus]